MSLQAVLLNYVLLRTSMKGKNMKLTHTMMSYISTWY